MASIKSGVCLVSAPTNFIRTDEVSVKFVTVSSCGVFNVYGTVLVCGIERTVLSLSLLLELRH